MIKGKEKGNKIKNANCNLTLTYNEHCCINIDVYVQCRLLIHKLMKIHISQ
jgi:hypothetical protein